MKTLTFLRLARVLFWLTVAVCAIPVHAASDLSDPLAGDWLYWGSQPATFYADGTVTWNNRHHGHWHGTWEYLHNPEVQRHYRIVWQHGESIDTLVLSEDKRSGHIRNETSLKHRQYNVRRAIPD